MNTPEPSAAASQIVKVLKQRDGTPTKVELLSGRLLVLHNIAWGQDFGDAEYHITSNISPAPLAPHEIDHFTTGDIRRIIDPMDGQVLYEK